MKAVLDNDILLKGVCYRLLQQLLSSLLSDGGQIGVLGAARYVVAKQIRKRFNSPKVEAYLENLSDTMDRVEVLEPILEEQQLAARLELAAQKARLALDSGESLLCAIVVVRALPCLLTGDKRAIKAFETLINQEVYLEMLAGKVRCFEQLVAELILKDDPQPIRAAICAEPDLDKALSICFSCYSPDIKNTCYYDNLDSYIRDLRSVAGRVLAP